MVLSHHQNARMRLLRFCYQTTEHAHQAVVMAAKFRLSALSIIGAQLNFQLFSNTSTPQSIQSWIGHTQNSAKNRGKSAKEASGAIFKPVSWYKFGTCARHVSTNACTKMGAKGGMPSRVRWKVDAYATERPFCADLKSLMS